MRSRAAAPSSCGLALRQGLAGIARAGAGCCGRSVRAPISALSEASRDRHHDLALDLHHLPPAPSATSRPPGALDGAGSPCRRPRPPPRARARAPPRPAGPGAGRSRMPRARQGRRGLPQALQHEAVVAQRWPRGSRPSGRSRRPRGSPRSSASAIACSSAWLQAARCAGLHPVEDVAAVRRPGAGRSAAGSAPAACPPRRCRPAGHTCHRPEPDLRRPVRTASLAGRRRSMIAAASRPPGGRAQALGR